MIRLDQVARSTKLYPCTASHESGSPFVIPKCYLGDDHYERNFRQLSRSESLALLLYCRFKNKQKLDSKIWFVNTRVYALDADVRDAFGIV